MIRFALRPLLCAAAAAPALSAQTWAPLVPASGPPARYEHAMVTAGAVAVMFGGYSGSAYLGDTWVFDGSTWSSAPGAAPSARASHAMALDEQRGTVVLFGGVDGVSATSILADTWERAGNTWTQRLVGVPPPARFGHALAYDRARSRVVMFGGRTNAGTILLNDTWEWDGSSWTLRTPAVAPTRRMSHTMAFDPVSGRVLLFGGIQLGGPIVGDTWAWDGSTWIALSPLVAPAPRHQASMATDEARQRVVLHGGTDGAALDDTWEWDGSQWLAVAQAGRPDGSVAAAMAAGPTGRHVVLFGGQGDAGAPQATTWWYGRLPGVSSFGIACGSPAPLLASAERPFVGASFASRLARIAPGELPFVSLGTSNTSIGGVPLPLYLGPLGMRGCWLHHDLAVLALPCSVIGAEAWHVLAVPNDPGLAGQTFYLQGYVLSPASNPMGIVTTNALALTIGH